MVLVEKRLDFLENRLDVARFEQLEPDYLALNPAGQVPALEAGGKVLTEAFLVMCWLDEAHPRPPLGGGDAAARYRVQEIGQLVECAIAPNLAVLEWQRGPAPSPEALMRLPPERRAWWEQALAGFGVAEVTAADVGLNRAFAGCEEWLGAHDWLAGAERTLADILLYPFAARLDLASLPRLAGWRERMGEFPSAAIVEQERPAITMGPERPRWG